METPASVVAARALCRRAKRRMIVARGLRLGAWLALVALILAALPLLRAKWQVADPTLVALAFPGTLILAGGLAACLACWTRPSDRDAARVLDRFAGTHEAFLTALDDRWRRADSRVVLAWAAQLAESVARIGSEPDHAAPVVDENVDRITRWARERPRAEDETARRMLAELARARTEDDVRRALERAVDRLDEERRHEAREAKRSLIEALRDGEGARAARAAARLEAADPELETIDRGDVSRALREALVAGADSERLDALASRLDEGGVPASGLAAGLAEALGVATPKAVPAGGETRELALEIRATLGATPSHETRASYDGVASSAARSPAERPDVRLDPNVWNDAQRALIRRYFERRGPRTTGR